ncbi:alpha/beta fold hydrolase [Clostridium sp. LBM24168]
MGEENEINGKFTKIMLSLLSVFLVIILILLSVLLIYSPGKIKPIRDKNGKWIRGSISEKVFVIINGIKQGMIIRGKNNRNPVILFLHGGPGMPEYFLAEKYMTNLEDNFTVCYWEQRGSGLSYNSNMSLKTITTEQLISDTLEVTNYLRHRFGQNKIYLVAHSWGSFIGIQAAARVPQLYEAYVGIGQISNQIESEKEAYRYMLGYYKNTGDSEMVKKLESYPILKSDIAINTYLSSSLRDNAMHKADIGTMHDMKSVVKGIFWPVMLCPAYTLNEKINIWRGKCFSQTSELKKLEYSTDLTKKVIELQLPVYFVSGKYDLTVSYSLAKSYLSEIKAPVKRFYLFEHSAHSPLYEESDKFLYIMKTDVFK